MTRQSTIALCLIAALATSACSTKPRKFSATVAPLSASSLVQSGSETDAFSTCDSLVRKGHKGNFAAAAGTGAAGALGGFGGVALSTTATYGSWSAAGATALAAIPIVGFASAFGVNRLIRSGREKSYKKHMDTCLIEFGYSVIDWTRVKKKQSATAMLQVAAPTPSAQQDLTPETPELANADPVSPISD
jgi:hypothetical protein